MSKIILHLCADMGTDSQPYRDAGYDVRCIGSDVGVENYHPPEGVYGIIANPVCTMLSWCRTHAKTPRDLERGMFLVRECLRVIWEAQYKLATPNDKLTTLKFWMIENPAKGFLRQFLGRPAFEFQPYEFGDTYKKLTATWGNFNLPVKTHTEIPDTPKFDLMKSKDIHPEAFGKLTRKERRSMCSPGFAKAFFEANL